MPIAVVASGGFPATLTSVIVIMALDSPCTDVTIARKKSNTLAKVHDDGMPSNNKEVAELREQRVDNVVA